MAVITPLTPPMGWNSWDCYGTTVTEAEVLANAGFMASHLLEHGWDTVVVDIDWSDPTAKAHGYNPAAPLTLDAYGRLLPDPARFPSAAHSAGFSVLASQLHALGLKFGIHIMRGIPRLAVDADLPIEGSTLTAAQVADTGNVCEWNSDMYGLNHDAGGQEYYDSILRLYAEWGVDFIKADDLLWPYQAREIEALHTAIERCGRDIVLSLSPGRDLSLSRLDHLGEHASMWRICDDLWDRWSDVEANFARFARWAPLAGEQGWPDGDMLPLGRVGLRAEVGEPRDDGFTPAERVSLMTLWLIARSPLMIGGDLPSSDPATVALFTNDDVLEVLRSEGGRELFRDGPLVIWGAWAGDTDYVAVFNLDEAAQRFELDVRNLLPGSEHAPLPAALTELWTGAVVPVDPAARRGIAPGSGAVLLDLDAHGAVLLRHDPQEDADV